MSKKHADVPPSLVGQLMSSVENIPNVDVALSELSNPPPAHSVTKSEPHTTLEDIDRATSSRLLKSYLMNKSNEAFRYQVSAPDIVEASKPLDFSKKSSSGDRKEAAVRVTTPKSTTVEEQDAVVSEDEPMDLSVSQPSISPKLAKVEDNQVESGILLKEWLSRIKRQP